MIDTVIVLGLFVLLLALLFGRPKAPPSSDTKDEQQEKPVSARQPDQDKEQTAPVNPPVAPARADSSTSPAPQDTRKILPRTDLSTEELLAELTQKVQIIDLEDEMPGPSDSTARTSPSPAPVPHPDESVPERTDSARPAADIQEAPLSAVLPHVFGAQHDQSEEPLARLKDDLDADLAALEQTTFSPELNWICCSLRLVACAGLFVQGTLYRHDYNQALETFRNCQELPEESLARQQALEIVRTYDERLDQETVTLIKKAAEYVPDAVKKRPICSFEALLQHARSRAKAAVQDTASVTATGPSAPSKDSPALGQTTEVSTGVAAEDRKPSSSPETPCVPNAPDSPNTPAVAEQPAHKKAREAKKKAAAKREDQQSDPKDSAKPAQESTRAAQTAATAATTAKEQKELSTAPEEKRPATSRTDSQTDTTVSKDAAPRDTSPRAEFAVAGTAATTSPKSGASKTGQKPPAVASASPAPDTPPRPAQPVVRPVQSGSLHVPETRIMSGGYGLHPRFNWTNNVADFCQQVLEEIHQDFRQDLSRLQKRCILCDLHFRGPHLPNYRLAPVQKLYLLKYFPANLIEYIRAFSYVQHVGMIRQPRIVSFGCANGIDGAAAHFVFPSYSYVGVDLVDWSHWVMDKPCIVGNAGDFKVTDQNIFVFPKSLNEFSSALVERMRAQLASTSADYFCIINSKRPVDVVDNHHCERLLAPFFSTCQILKHSINKAGNYLSAYQPWFQQHPYKDELISLSRGCPSRHRCSGYCHCPIQSCDPDRGENDKPMNRYPVLKDSNFNTDIYYLNRKAR